MIYLDYNATTPVAAQVLEAMLPWLTAGYGNPSSGHELGRAAHAAIDKARDQVASLLGAHADEIVFTSGGTESSNMAIRGSWHRSARTTLVTSAIEHPATSAPCRHLVEAHGATLRVVEVDEHGVVLVDALTAAIDTSAAVVSVMHSNNEVGTLQPIAEIAAVSRAAGAIVHTDAAQSVGKVPLDVEALGVDLLTVAGHKLYAPKGIGALYVRRGTDLRPILFGAGHERGMRPGTENVPYIVGLGAACELAASRLQGAAALRARRDALHAALRAAVPALVLNGHPERRLPNTLNVSFPTNARALLDALGDVAASTGSACHDDLEEPSGVLVAMGARERASGAVRFSLGWETTDEDVDEVARLVRTQLCT